MFAISLGAYVRVLAKSSVMRPDSTCVVGGLGDLQKHLMKNDNPVAAKLRKMKTQAVSVQEKKTIPTQYSGV